jgi:flagellar motor component MotA
MILAATTLIFALVAKPPFKPARLSISLVALIIVQTILGFGTIVNGNMVIAWVHLLNALAIYGTSIAGIFLAIQWSRMLDAIPGKLGGQAHTRRESIIGLF